ncbi:DUF4232 domain-containing protein [Streptomyces sp. NPDC093085]|uniref:DUF4232 domain-containing protein n=1 Tax=Streptomyces sp. NPDC093085 TaxID=3155068 RepID=UPI003425335B
MSEHFQNSGETPPRRGRPGAPARRAGGRRAWRTAALAATATLLAVATAACGSGGGSAGGSADPAPSASAGAPSGTGAAGEPSAASAGADSSGGASSGGASATAPRTTDTAGSAAPSAPAAPSATGNSSVGTQSATSYARCTAARLGLSLSSPNPGAGQVYYDLRLVNKGSAPCTLRGFPGVSLLAGDGAPIGRPATREGGQLPAVNLKPGVTAYVTLHTLNQGIKGDSCWARPSLLQVYPPGSTDAMTLATSEPRVCGDTFTVGAVRAD